MGKVIERFMRDESGAVVLNWGILGGSMMLLFVVAHGTLLDSYEPLSASASLSLRHQ